MTVSDLIAALQTCDPGKPVKLRTAADGECDNCNSNVYLETTREVAAVREEIGKVVVI